MPVEMSLVTGTGPDKGRVIDLKNQPNIRPIDAYRFHRLIELSVLLDPASNRREMTGYTSDEITSYLKVFDALPADRKKLNSIQFTTGFDDDPNYPRKTSLAKLRRIVRVQARRDGILQ